MFYSANTGGFYTPQINGENIPGDAVEITEDKYLKLLQAQSNGKIITSDDNGNPVAIDPPAPTKDELIADAEYKRQQLLAHADAVMLDWRTELMLGEISDANKAKLSAWLAYKNEVKSVDVTTDPDHVNWPTPPEA